MNLHERSEAVAKARLEIREFITGAIGKHGLTYGELLSILGQEICGWAKLLVLDERGEANKPEVTAETGIG